MKSRTYHNTTNQDEAFVNDATKKSLSQDERVMMVMRTFKQ